MWKSKHREEDSKYENIVCPVCKADFGRRDKEKICKAHCEECKASFYWHPGEDKPSVVMDKDVKKQRRYCGKDGCFCRD